MAASSFGASIVVHITDADRVDVVLARITSRSGDGEAEVTRPLLVTASELSEEVSAILARLCHEVLRATPR